MLSFELYLLRFRNGSDRSEYDKRGLYCNQENEKIDSFRLNNSQFMDQLMPVTIEPEIAPNTVNKEINQTAIQELTLQQHLKHIMMNGKLNIIITLEVNMLKTRIASLLCR